LLTDARTNPDPNAGKKDGEEANRLFAKECWVIPTAWTIWGMVAKPELQGLGTTTFPRGEPGTLLDGVTPFPGQVFFTNAWLKK
jgi:hypothetical protein